MSTTFIPVLETALKDPPSLKGNEPLTRDQERASRIQCARMIQQAGLLMQASTHVIYTAQSCMHRFYYRRSMQEFPLVIVAMACLCIAHKVCAREVPLGEILACFDRALAIDKDTPRERLRVINLQSQRLVTWRQRTKSTEFTILKELGFDMYVLPPHSFLSRLREALALPDPLVRLAFAILNDVGASDVTVRLPPLVLAVASVDLASRFLGIPLPLPKTIYSKVLSDESSSSSITPTQKSHGTAPLSSPSTLSSVPAPFESSDNVNSGDTIQTISTEAYEWPSALLPRGSTWKDVVFVTGCMLEVGIRTEKSGKATVPKPSLITGDSET